MSGQADNHNEAAAASDADGVLDSDPAATGPDDVNDSSIDQQCDELEVAQAKADENWDRYLRAAAELENVRKRASRDVENARKFALERFARELLGVKDSLEMGIAAADGASIDSLLEGSAATLKLLGSTLQQFGVEELNPEGEPFDPEFHEAISAQPSDSVEPGSVMNVVQKGYALNGRLLRPAMVIVAAS